MKVSFGHLPVRLSKNKPFDLIIGIPSYNEADTIPFVVKQVDIGINKYFPDSKAIIINADNNSPDNTKKAFLKTKTKTPKIYISTPKEIRGKGNNVYNILKKAQELNAKNTAIIDADLKSITPEWVKKLIYPVKYNNYDFVLPLYERNEYDGSITNHICYPLIYGLLGVNARQPIGGEFSFSKEFVDYLLSKKWDKTTKNYGVDIFLTLNAILNNFKIAQVNLHKKVHKPSAPKLGPMFFQVAASCFSLLVKNKKIWLKKIKSYTPLIIYKNKNHYNPQKLPVDYKDLKQKSLYEFSLYYKIIKECLGKDIYGKLEKMYFEKKILNIKTDLWMKILYSMLWNYDNKKMPKEKIIRALRPLYFGRTVTFIKQTLELSSKESELAIQKQAEYFYKHRSYLLKKYKSIT